MIPPAVKRLGFSLVELLCVIVVIAVAGGILLLLLRQTLAMERSQSGGGTQMLLTQALADQFRADVAQAENAPLEWQKYKADPHTLILQMKNQDYVIYLKTQETWKRHTFSDQQHVERALPLDNSRVGVEFVQTMPNPKLIRMRLLTLRGGATLPGQTLVIDAALGGAWR